MPKKETIHSPHSPVYGRDPAQSGIPVRDPVRQTFDGCHRIQIDQQSKVYLSAILDLGGEKIIAHKLSRSNNNALVNETIISILDKVLPGQAILHSDRGYQYTLPVFRQLLKKHEVIQSMSRVGKCIDNGPMENFWGILKTELYYLDKYDTFEQLSHDIDRYIHFFNMKRITLKMGLAIPV